MSGEMRVSTVKSSSYCLQSVHRDRVNQLMTVGFRRQQITPNRPQAENKFASAAAIAAVTAAASAEDTPPPLPITLPPPLEDEYEEIEYGTGAQKATFSIRFGTHRITALT